MDWRALGESVAKLGLPLLGAVLPIPGGAAIGAALASRIGANNTPDDIWDKLRTYGDALSKAKDFELTHEKEMLQMQLDYEIKLRDADSHDVDSVNQTMREEAIHSAEESWYQKGWRPFNGFIVGLGSFVAVLFTCFLFYLAIVEHDNTAIAIIPSLASSIALILGVPGAAVGITAWHRGITQRIATQKQGGHDGPVQSTVRPIAR